MSPWPIHIAPKLTLTDFVLVLNTVEYANVRKQWGRSEPNSGVIFQRHVTVPLPQAREGSDERAEVVIRLAVVAALHSELDECELRVDKPELSRLLPDWIESVLDKKYKKWSD